MTRFVQRTAAKAAAVPAAKDDVIRSVTRAIELLQALNQQSVSTVDDLHRRTRIPKATIARLLRTFESKGLVAQSSRFGAYYLASGIASLHSGYTGKSQAIEHAIPLCDALTRKVKWPVTLALFDVDAMVVRYSTIAQSPLSLLHSSINLRRSMVGRALGRAYLAFCGREEQQFIIESLRASPLNEDHLVHDLPALREILRGTRKQGYALRDPAFSDRSCTMAIPVFQRKKVVATLGLTWFSSIMCPEVAVGRYLEPLRETAGQISDRLGQLEREATSAAAARRPGSR